MGNPKKYRYIEHICRIITFLLIHPCPVKFASSERYVPMSTYPLMFNTCGRKKPLIKTGT